MGATSRVCASYDQVDGLRARGDTITIARDRYAPCVYASATIRPPDAADDLERISERHAQSRVRTLRRIASMPYKCWDDAAPRWLARLALPSRVIQLFDLAQAFRAHLPPGGTRRRSSSKKLSRTVT